MNNILTLVLVSPKTKAVIASCGHAIPWEIYSGIIKDLHIDVVDVCFMWYFLFVFCNEIDKDVIFPGKPCFVIGSLMKI